MEWTVFRINEKGNKLLSISKGRKKAFTLLNQLRIKYPNQEKGIIAPNKYTGI